MNILRVPKKAACALCLAGLLSSSAIVTASAYADQTFNQDVQSVVTEVAQKIEKANVPEPMSVFDQHRDDLLGNTDLLLSQTGSGRCTLAANAMILRRAAFIEGDENWDAITEQSLGQMVWSGRGMPNEFTAYGKSVGFHTLEEEGSGKAQELIDLLDEHPEGLAVYDPGVPHALLLICYDQEEDRFLCADPAAYNGGKVLELSESWNGQKRGSNQAVLSNLRSYWCIDA